MPRIRYQIVSDNGKRRHVNREERDKLLLAGVLKQIGPQEYLCTLQLVTLHSLSELDKVRQHLISQKRTEPDYYAGQFVWELGERRFTERMESTEAMTIRLQAQRAV